MVGGAMSLVPGCGSSRDDVLVPVSGKVKVEGKPLTTGWVTYYPDETQGNKSMRLPHGEIKADGSYELFTNGKQGAPRGSYKVVVSAVKEPLPVKPRRNTSGAPTKPKWLIAEKYTRPETTELAREVVAGAAPGRYDLELQR
jgi:hypothetical protein